MHVVGVTRVLALYMCVPAPCTCVCPGVAHVCPLCVPALCTSMSHACCGSLHMYVPHMSCLPHVFKSPGHVSWPFTHPGLLRVPDCHTHVLVCYVCPMCVLALCTCVPTCPSSVHMYVLSMFQVFVYMYVLGAHIPAPCTCVSPCVSLLSACVPAFYMCVLMCPSALHVCPYVPAFHTHMSPCLSLLHVPHVSQPSTCVHPSLLHVCSCVCQLSVHTCSHVSQPSAHLCLLRVLALRRCVPDRHAHMSWPATRVS